MPANWLPRIRNRRAWPIWWLRAVVIVLAALLVAVMALFTLQSDRPSSDGQVSVLRPGSTVSASDALTALEQQYRQEVQAIFADWDRQQWTSEDFQRAVSRLLEVTVPNRYRSLHLDLVIALTSVLRGLTEGWQPDLEQGLSQLETAFVADGWIRQHGGRR